MFTSRPAGDTQDGRPARIQAAAGSHSGRSGRPENAAARFHGQSTRVCVQTTCAEAARPRPVALRALTGPSPGDAGTVQFPHKEALHGSMLDFPVAATGKTGSSASFAAR